MRSEYSLSSRDKTLNALWVYFNRILLDCTERDDPYAKQIRQALLNWGTDDSFKFILSHIERELEGEDEIIEIAGNENKLDEIIESQELKEYWERIKIQLNIE